MDVKGYLQKKKKIIDSFLEGYFQDHHPPSLLSDAIKYSLFAGGKRIRPILCLMAYEACGGDGEDILPQAGALELIHTYSLIHDDLPAMDNDDLRRGKPTNHKVFGEAMAILAGDGLLTEAFFMFSKNDKIPHTRLLYALRELSFSAGIRGMVSGQAMDIISEGREVEKEILDFIHSHKTADLIRASVKIGGILSKTDEQKVNALSRYGEHIGLAFQIIDDILDRVGNTEEMGKSTGSDDLKKKMTYPVLYGIEKSQEIAEGHIRNALHAVEGFRDNALWLKEIANYLLMRTH